jgi:hypothetical protein
LSAIIVPKILDQGCQIQPDLLAVEQEHQEVFLEMQNHQQGEEVVQV